ncbi:MAG: crossover junction endodeoxyribonuclease RuvC [Firmicutes bacterium]|uniref:Crossover junction endodeoxyribonuclease RuvC n=1 Tax=Melghirimyces thermohalophilus TaxID=1236220 RepID=A0A1G6JKC9_9BACL|nr:crossover junction endodeoxyribonuclease RuvC [Melghirimyces thermohalophilus]MDA8352260.1 crossover junction endodeoxyribonuclease RuvC [Bacillota bacterium]SDC18885.1 Holliday junction endonuclease RuvC [Melghirimyces thermohalophilus]
MRILGIDPGIAIVGYGVIDQRGNRLKPVDYGSIQTEAGLPTATRLKQIYDAATQLFSRFQPEVVAIEKLFFNRNVTTAFAVGQARGVVMLAAEETGAMITEYTPLQVKMAVVGYGQAQKRQIQEMVRMLLNLPEIPKPDDVADALGVAICQAHSTTFSKRIGQGREGL